MNSARSMAANAVVRLRLSNRPRAGRPARRAAAMFGVLAALIIPAVAACGFTTTSAPLAGATTADSNAAGASTPSVQKQAGIISRPVRVLFKNRTGNPLPTLFCGDLLYKSTCTAYEAANGGVIEFISDKVQVFVDPPEGSDPASAASFIIAGVNPSVGSPSVWLSSGITNQQLNDARETSRTNPIPYSENKYLYPNGYTQHYVDAETYTNPDIIFAGHRIYVERQKDDTYIGYVFEIRS